VPAPRKFDAETMARAVRMYQDRLTERGESKLQARRAVGAFAARGRRPRHSRQDPAAGGPGSPDDTPHHVVPSTPSSSWVLRCDIKALRLFLSVEPVPALDGERRGPTGVHLDRSLPGICVALNGGSLRA
jgi:hypothetical protein